MKIEEMIETLRYKAMNIKAKIEPDFFYEVADALEKQVPKKVAYFKLAVDAYECPNCEDISLKISAGQYCRYCGQKLDWSEVDVEAKED